MNENNRNYRIDPERGIIVPNYCAAQLPKITVEIKSGRTTYRFTGRYDGNRSLPGKLLDRMAAIIWKRIKKRGEMFTNGCYNKHKQSCIGRLPAD